MSRILIVVGHAMTDTYCEALGQSYARGARAGGHHADLVVVSRLDFDPILRTGYRELQPLEPDLQAALAALRAADHLVIIFPLWLGTMPAILKGFLERVLQPDSFEPFREGRYVPFLKGKSARIIMTMAMPGLAFRWYYGAALKVLRRNILGFVGVSPVRSTIHGMIATVGEDKRQRWLDEAEAMGRAGC